MTLRSVPLVLLWTLLLAAPAVGVESAPVGSQSNPIPSPGAFYVRGTNGYTISVYADSRGGRSRAIVSAVGSFGRLTVSAPADFTAEGIRADLGRYGRVDMAWVPNGQAEEGASHCRGGPRTPIWFAGGEYVGSMTFRGEEDFTAAETQAVNGRQGWWRYEGCGYSVSEGYPGPGILLEAELSRKDQARDVYRYFSVVQNHLGGKVSYEAAMGESHGPFEVYRSAYVLAGGGTLRVGEKLDRAEVRPADPFGGHGVFERTKRRGPGTWRGNLTVDFPGRPDVSLTGRRWTASLMHGFREIEPTRLALRAKR